jgi:putative YphP/YqiW family bacilliredoxin
MYPAEIVTPFIEDLTTKGFVSLTSSEEVDQRLSSTEGTKLVVINSVCGCAARNARPAAKMAVENDKKPDEILTVFAGFNVEATNQVRKYCLPYPPSSPSMALFKNGQLVHFIERHHIEGRPAEAIAENLIEAFKEHC